MKTLEEKNFENAQRKNNFEVEEFRRKISVIWNHKDSYSIHVDQNHTESNQSTPANSTNILSIKHPANIFAIEKI